jgi:predicted transcriptional regulator
LQEAFLTVAEIAELLKLNPQTVRNWIKSGIPDLIHYLDSRVIWIGGLRAGARLRLVVIESR